MSEPEGFDMGSARTCVLNEAHKLAPHLLKREYVGTSLDYLSTDDLKEWLNLSTEAVHQLCLTKMEATAPEKARELAELCSQSERRVSPQPE